MKSQNLKGIFIQQLFFLLKMQKQIRIQWKIILSRISRKLSIFTFCSQVQISLYLNVNCVTNVLLCFHIIYPPPTMLRKSHAFSRVCLSVSHSGHKGLLVLCPSFCTGPPPDMLKLVQLGPYCTGIPPDIFKFRHYVAHNVGKRAVGIRVKSLLVLTCSHDMKQLTFMTYKACRSEMN